MGNRNYPAEIDLSYNHIYWIDRGSFELVGLRRLDISYNHISSVHDISLWFGDTLFGTNLETIDLTFNKIQTPA